MAEIINLWHVEQARQQLRQGNKLARKKAEERGYELHPKLREREPRFGPVTPGEGIAAALQDALEGKYTLCDILRREPDEADWNNDDPGAA